MRLEVYARVEDHEAIKAYAANVQQWEKIRLLAMQCAEWHLDDMDQCGEIAQELYKLLAKIPT